MCCNDPETGQSQLEEFIKQKDPEKTGLCLCDDFVRQNARPDDPYKMFITGISQFLRNVKYHNIMVSQSPKGIPEGARNNCNLRITFKLESPKSLKPVQEEFEGAGMGPVRYFNSLYHGMLKGGRFSYLCLTSDQDEPRIFIHLQNRGENHLARLPTFEQVEASGSMREIVAKPLRPNAPPKVIKMRPESDEEEEEEFYDSDMEDETRPGDGRSRSEPKGRRGDNVPRQPKPMKMIEDSYRAPRMPPMRSIRRDTHEDEPEPVIRLRKRYQRT
jgi:hypothetical protein